MNHRLAGLFGLAFAGIYFVYLTLLDSPDISTSSQEAVDFWADSATKLS